MLLRLRRLRLLHRWRLLPAKRVHGPSRPLHRWLLRKLRRLRLSRLLLLRLMLLLRLLQRQRRWKLLRRLCKLRRHRSHLHLSPSRLR